MSAAEASRWAGVRVELAGIRRTFGGRVDALAGIDLAVPPGQFLALLGPSGCGKSTLLRVIAGLERADAGTCSVGTTSSRDVAFVFQDAHLLPWRRVIGNVELPLELMGVPAAERREAAREAIEQVGLADAHDRYPAELSGGMRMRVSLARALVGTPRLLLLDEPFAALDEITRLRLDDQLRALWSARGMTVVFVTHNVTEAVFLAERAVVLSRRPARIVLDRSIELPAERSQRLRADPRFGREVVTLVEALEHAEAGP